MPREPNVLVRARTALMRAEKDLGDPQGLDELRSAVHALLEVIDGESPKIEKDIAVRLTLSCRSKVLSELKLVLANVDSSQSTIARYWNDVLEIFVEAGLGEEPEFNACREQLLASCAGQPVDSPDEAWSGSLKQASQATRAPGDVSFVSGERGRTVFHAKPLKAIGRSLAMLHLQSFKLNTTGDSYIVRSESLTSVHRWMLESHFAGERGAVLVDGENVELTVGDGWIRYRLHDAAPSNTRGQRGENNHASEHGRQEDPLVELLYTLGEHLDTKGATGFEISWMRDSIAVDYQISSGVREQQKFTVKKLQQLASYSVFRRSSRRPSLGSRRDLRP